MFPFPSQRSLWQQELNKPPASQVIAIALNARPGLEFGSVLEGTSAKISTGHERKVSFDRGHSHTSNPSCLGYDDLGIAKIGEMVVRRSKFFTF